MGLTLVTSHADSILLGATVADAQLKILVLEARSHQQHQSAARQRTGVQVTNENDAPVTGAVVTFMLPDAGPGGVFGDRNKILSVTTDEKVSGGRGLRANKIVGQYQILVSASYQGRNARTSITQTNAGLLPP